MRTFIGYSVVVAAALSTFGCAAQVEGDGSTGSNESALVGSSAPTGPYECPAYIPVVGYACSGDYSCNITNTCGSLTTATCSGGAWSVSGPAGCTAADGNVVAPGSSDCPRNPLVANSQCWVIPGTSCSYSNTCGGNDKFTCNGGTWNLQQTCAPACPTTRPTAGTSCSFDQNCTYPTACGNYDAATCSGGKWYVSLASCSTSPSKKKK
jgi:hypothetical protein